MCSLYLIVGPNWRLLSLLAYGFLALAFLVSGFGIASLMRAVMSRGKSITAKPTVTPQPAGPIIGQTAAKTAQASKSALLLFVGFAAGVATVFGVMHHTDRRSYSDVLVVARHDSTHYTLQPQWMKPWEMTTCSPMDWEAGQKMQFLNFQYHSACDDVENGSFVFYSRPDGQRMIYASEVLNAGE